MEYKGYIAKVEIDDEAGILFGEVINIRDVITRKSLSFYARCCEKYIPAFLRKKL